MAMVPSDGTTMHTRTNHTRTEGSKRAGGESCLAITGAIAGCQDVVFFSKYPPRNFILFPQQFAMINSNNLCRRGVWWFKNVITQEWWMVR